MDIDRFCRCLITELYFSRHIRQLQNEYGAVRRNREAFPVASWYANTALPLAFRRHALQGRARRNPLAKANIVAGYRDVDA